MTMPLSERQVVSRKTPLDGKLEISSNAAARLAALGTELPLASGGQEGIARLTSMECTCAKAAAGPHRHHFVESSLLARLMPGDAVRVELDEETGILRVESVT